MDSRLDVNRRRHHTPEVRAKVCSPTQQPRKNKTDSCRQGGTGEVRHVVQSQKRSCGCSLNSLTSLSQSLSASQCLISLQYGGPIFLLLFAQCYATRTTKRQARLRALKSKPDDGGTLTILRQLKYLQTGGGAGGDGAGGGVIGCSEEVPTAGERGRASVAS